MAPSPARTRRCCRSRPTRSLRRWAGRRLTPRDVDLYEINEAVAAVALQSMRDLEMDASNVNGNGGVISMGHPVDASGARIALHLALKLGRRGGGLVTPANRPVASHCSAATRSAVSRYRRTVSPQVCWSGGTCAG